MKYSFWERNFITNPTDFTILGSGIVGLSTAISIKEKSPDTTVKIIERGSMPYGASTKNAGYCCFGSMSELIQDISTMGLVPCMEVVHMRFDGLARLRKRCGDQIINYKPNQGTELFRKQDEEIKTQCLDQIDYFNELMSDHLHISDTYTIGVNKHFRAFDNQMIVNQHEGSINPMDMMRRLMSIAQSLGVEIHLGVNVDRIDMEEHILRTTEMNIPYQKLIVCTNGFTKMLLPHLDVQAARNQVIMTRTIPGFDLPSCYHIDGGYIYFRSYDQRILLGGGRNIDPQTEATDQFGTTPIIQAYLAEILESIHPGSAQMIDMTWSGILGVGPSKYPICEWVNDDLLVGVRMGGMGVAIGSHLGDKLAEMAL